MHRVGSAGNTANSVRPRKEKRLTYVLSDADDTKVKWFLTFIVSIFFLFLAFKVSMLLSLMHMCSFYL